MNDAFQKPLTSHMKSSYCDYLKTISPNSVGEAQVFIAQAWKNVFLDVVDTLQYHFRDSPDIIIWFDLFSDNQHSAPDLDFHWWSTTYESAIEQFNHTVLILSPWNNPIPLTRAWCLFEIYCTVVCKCKFEIAMSPSDQRDFLEAIQADATESINTMLATLDVRKSESWNPDDKNRIFDAVERTVGIDGINSIIFERLREWVIDTVLESLPNAATAEERASLQLSLGILYMNQGRYVLAENYIKDSLTVRENILGEYHPDSLKSMSTLAFLYQRMGRYDEALPLFTECLALRDNELGEDHSDTLVSMNALASLYHNVGRNDEALPLHTKCLALREDVLGEKHPDTLISINNLAVLYDSMGRYDEALRLHTKCLAFREQVLDRNHPDTLTSMNNLASLYEHMGRYDEALSLRTMCLETRNVVLGEKHPDTLESMNGLAVLYSNMGRQEDSSLLKARYSALIVNLEKEKRK